MDITRITERDEKMVKKNLGGGNELKFSKINDIQETTIPKISKNTDPESSREYKNE